METKSFDIFKAFIWVGGGGGSEKSQYVKNLKNMKYISAYNDIKTLSSHFISENHFMT